MRRREFLVGAAAALGFSPARTGLASIPAWGQASPHARDETKLRRVAIMSLGFGGILKNFTQPDSPARTLDILDLPRMYVDRYGVHNVEMQHAHFPSTDRAFLEEFRRRLEQSKSRVTNINLEFGPQNISAADPALRQAAIERTKEWIDHAVVLGCPRVMVNQGAPTEENKADAIAALKAMGDYGNTKQVMVAMENRGGRGGPWQLLVEIIRGSGTYANCDLGNFPDQQTQHAGMRGLFPLTDGNCHVKLNPARYDLPAALALTRELGYKGLYSIEATGSSPDPREAVRRIYDIYDILLANM